MTTVREVGEFGLIDRFADLIGRMSPPPADLLVTKPQGYYGYVEFQPYCEGWGWVESALAIQEGVPFKPYQTRRVTTQADIDTRYRELYGEKHPYGTYGLLPSQSAKVTGAQIRDFHRRLFWRRGQR